MPDGMSGFQLAQEIRRRLPGIPIVLTSGVVSPADPAREAMRDCPILRKPFRRSEVLQAIEAALSPDGATPV
jgi:CheY-like chemotaxis protein